MSEDRDHDVQAWFNRSVEEPLSQPFTLAVLERVRRRERYLRLQLYAAWSAVFASCCLLLPKLIVPLNMLVALPLALVDAGGEQWPLLALLAMGAGWALVRHLRNTGFLRHA